MFGIFVSGTLLHLALGLLVAATVWLGGMGGMAMLDRRDAMTATDRLGFGYPLGLVLTVGAALAALLHWVGAAIGGVVLAATLLRGVAALPALHRQSPNLLPGVAWSLPPTALVAFIIGLLNRGPTATLGATGLSDVIWWAERIVNIAAAPYPTFNHIGEGLSYSYAQQGLSTIGARLSLLPGFDPFLFNAVAGQVLFGVNLAIIVLLLRDGRSRLPPQAAIGLALLLIGAPIHPSWTIQSVTVVLLYPLFAVAFRTATAELPGLRAGLAIAVACVAASFASKVFALLLLAPPLGLRLWRLIRTHLPPLGRVLLLLGGGGAMLIYAGVMVWDNRFSIAEFRVLHLPLLSPYLRWQDGSESAWRGIALAIRDIGGLALVWFAARHAMAWLRWLIPLCIVGFWLWYSALPIVLTGAAVLAALDLAAKPERPRTAWIVAGFGGTCLAAHGVMVEYNGPVTIAALVLAQLVAMLVPLSVGQRFGRLTRAAGMLAGAGAIAACVVLLTADRWFLSTVARNWPMPLTPAQHDMWHRVTDLVPKHGLVFTDQTGEGLTALEGLNYYPAFSGRQIYLSGWYATPLRIDEAGRKRQQERNAAVLSGATAPADLPLSRAYDGFFAVIRGDKPAPPGARALYRNDELALYALAPR